MKLFEQINFQPEKSEQVAGFRFFSIFYGNKRHIEAWKDRFRHTVRTTPTPLCGGHALSPDDSDYVYYHLIYRRKSPNATTLAQHRFPCKVFQRRRGLSSSIPRLLPPSPVPSDGRPFWHKK